MGTLEGLHHVRILNMTYFGLTQTIITTKMKQTKLKIAETENITEQKSLLWLNKNKLQIKLYKIAYFGWNVT